MHFGKDKDEEKRTLLYKRKKDGNATGAKGYQNILPQIDVVCGNPSWSSCYLDYGKYEGNDIFDGISACFFRDCNLRRGTSGKSGKAGIFVVEEDFTQALRLSNKDSVLPAQGFQA